MTDTANAQIRKKEDEVIFNQSIRSYATNCVTNTILIY